MSETQKGTLRWTPGRDNRRAWMLKWTSRGGKPQDGPPHFFEISHDLTAAADREIEVEYELGPDGFPDRIRRVGSQWVRHPTAASPTIQREPARPGPQVQGGPAPGPARQGHFHNPYNFVPAVPPVERKADGDLGQARPVGHKAWYDGYFSGRITVDIEVKTPLLVPDASKAHKEANGHVILPLLTERDGITPKLPATSFKGALRSAYEAITNSRLAVFQGHDVPLGRRMEASEGLAMVPARIDASGRLELWMGTLNPRDDSEFHTKRPQANRRPPGNVMYAAWLPRYFRNGTSAKGPAYDRKNAVRYPDESYPRHGDDVVCWLRQYRKVNQSGQTRFAYWRVEQIRRGHDLAELTESALTSPPQRLGNFHELVPTQHPIRGWGYVFITNQNIGNKHDERVFFVPEMATPYRPNLGVEDLASWRAEWKHLVADYRGKAKKTIDLRMREGIDCDTYLGRDIGRTALSRHICAESAAALGSGDLCFARVESDGRITGLFPVMISREVAKLTPLDLLPASLRPASAVGNLSPADRVFGWVRQGSGKTLANVRGAYRGHLRITSMRFLGCKEPDGTTKEPITYFGGDGLPLAILATPKPEQARFYVARDKSGTPQENNLSRTQAAYDYAMTGVNSTSKGLRGRKFYPHHRSLPIGYWDGPGASSRADEAPEIAQQVNGRFREYVRVATDHESLRDDQNRSIEGWVNPDARFQAEIDIANLSKVELGALLFLLTLPADHFARIGGGKPLGFGSVHLKLAQLALVDGQARRQDFLTILPPARPTANTLGLKSTQLGGIIDTYRAAVVTAYGAEHDDFEKIPFIAAFLNAARGFDDKPIHYPRTTKGPSPEGRNFEWFVGNESRDGPKQALNALWTPIGLSFVRDIGREDTPAPRAPRETAVTTKSRQDHDVRNMPYLANILRQRAKSIEDLFELSKLRVEDFYKQLIWEVGQGHIQDVNGTLKAS